MDASCDRTLVLEFVGESQQNRFTPVASCAQEGKTSVIVTATHANAMPRVIEGNQRGEDQVEVAWRHQVQSLRFRNAEAIGYQCITGMVTREPEFVVHERHQYRQVNGLAL